MNAVELAPIVKTLDVTCTPDRAFRAFTAEIAAWWPLHSHSRAPAGRRAVGLSVEPRVGGRVFETLDDGRELDWGEVLAWQPGALFELSWQLGNPPERATRVSVRFEPSGDEGCRVTLIHSDWERLGEAAAERRSSYDSGWAGVFEEAFGGYANAA